MWVTNSRYDYDDSTYTDYYYKESISTSNESETVEEEEIEIEIIPSFAKFRATREMKQSRRTIGNAPIMKILRWHSAKSHDPRRIAA